MAIVWLRHAESFAWLYFVVAEWDCLRALMMSPPLSHPEAHPYNSPTPMASLSKTVTHSSGRFRSYRGWDGLDLLGALPLFESTYGQTIPTYMCWRKCERCKCKCWCRFQCFCVCVFSVYTLVQQLVSHCCQTGPWFSPWIEVAFFIWCWKGSQLSTTAYLGDQSPIVDCQATLQCHQYSEVAENLCGHHGNYQRFLNTNPFILASNNWKWCPWIRMAKAMNPPWKLPRNFPVAHKREKLGNTPRPIWPCRATDATYNDESFRWWFEVGNDVWFPFHLGLATLLRGISPTTRSQRGSGVHCHFVAGGMKTTSAWFRWQIFSAQRCMGNDGSKVWPLMSSIAPASGGLCSTGQQGGSAGSDCTGYNFYNQTSWVFLFGGLGQIFKWPARFTPLGTILVGKDGNICVSIWNIMKHDVLKVWNMFNLFN